MTSIFAMTPTRALSIGQPHKLWLLPLSLLYTVVAIFAAVLAVNAAVATVPCTVLMARPVL